MIGFYVHNTVMTRLPSDRNRSRAEKAAANDNSSSFVNPVLVDKRAESSDARAIRIRDRRFDNRINCG